MKLDGDVRSDRRWVLVLAVVLFGWNLWGYDLWAPDEPYFGEGAREMIADGQWLVPHVNGEVTTDKPPVFFWLIALLSWPFGSVSSLTARLPSVLAALGSLWLTMRWARRWSGARVAVLAGAMLAPTYMFWDKARSAQIDSLLCFLILVALSGFEAFRSGAARGRLAGWIFWGAAALAVLAKGPVGVLLPLGIALVTLALDRDLRQWRSFAPFSGPMLFAVITGLWVLAVSLWGGDYSVWGALEEHFVDRAIRGMHHEQPFWYYLRVLPHALFPWSFLVPGALVLAWRRRREPSDRFLLVFALFVVVFFSIPTEKRDLYILPAVPAFALLASRLVAAVVGWWPPAAAAGSKAPHRRWVTLPQGAVGALLVLAAVAVPIVARRFGSELIAPAAVLAAVLAVGGLGALVTAVRGRALGTVQWSGATMAVALLVAVTLLYPALNPRKSGRQLALVVRDATAESRAAGRPVLTLGAGNVPRAVSFYSDGIYLNEVSGEELIGHLSAGGTVYLLADEAALPPLPDDFRQRMSVVCSTRLSRKDLLLVRFEPVPATR